MSQQEKRLHVLVKNDRKEVRHPAAAHQAHGRTTAHFRVSFDPALGPDGATIANSILATCEQDFITLQGFFGGITPANLPFHIIVTTGSDGASHAGCEATELSIGANSTDGGLDLPLMRQLVIAEEDEVFEANFGTGWNCGQSHGEGLSRVLGNDMVPGAQTAGFVTAPSWLNQGRPNFVDQTEDTDVNPISTGCAVLFLNWLHFQLNHSWADIIGAGQNTATLGETYQSLTGKNDGFKTFKALIDQRFPPGVPANLTTDNPFPLPGA